MAQFSPGANKNLHKWVFQKAEIARAASASAGSALWKTHKCKYISNWPRKTVWLLNNINLPWKNSHKGIATKTFLDAVFCIQENYIFKVSVPNFCQSLAWRDVIGLQNAPCLSTNHNSELRWVICTGVTLKLHCSQPIRIEQFFHVNYYNIKSRHHLKRKRRVGWG